MNLFKTNYHRTCLIACVLILILAVTLFIDGNTDVLVHGFKIDGGVKHVTISPNAKYSAAIDWNGNVYWMATADAPVNHFIDSGPVNYFAVLFSYDEKQMVLGGDDGRVRVISTETGETLLSFPVLNSGEAGVGYRILPDGTTYPKQAGIFTLAMNEDGTQLLVGGVNGQIALINTTNWHIIRKARVLESFDVTTLVFSPNNDYVVVGTRTSHNIVSVLNSTTLMPVVSRDFGRLFDHVETVAFDAVHNKLLVGGYPRYIASFDFAQEDFANLEQFTTDARNFGVLRLSSDGAIIARSGFVANGDEFTDGLPIIGQGDNQVYLHYLPVTNDFQTVKETGICRQEDQRRMNISLPISCPILIAFQKFSKHQAAVTTLDINHTNTHVISGDKEGVIYIWRINH